MAYPMGEWLTRSLPETSTARSAVTDRQASQLITAHSLSKKPR